MENTDTTAERFPHELEETQQRITTMDESNTPLSRNEDFADIIINSVIDTIFIFDVNTGKPVIWNKAFRDITGFTDKEIASKKAPDDWYLKDDLKKLKSEIKNILNGEKVRIEGNLITKDGKSIPTEYTASPIKDPSGKSVYIITIGRDTTERKQAEEALHESEEKFYKAFHSSPDAITITTLKDGKFIEVNDSFIRATGYARDEVIGQSSLDLNIWMNSEERTNLMRRLVKKGLVNNEEVTLRKKSGELGDVLYSAAKLNISGEECIIDVSTDITERKQMAEVYQTIFDYSLQGLAITQDFRFTFVNSALAELSGYTVKELLDFTPEDVRAMVHPDDREFVFGIAQKRLRGEQVPGRFEFRFIRKDGTVRWAEQYARLIEYKGKPTTIVAYIDISERKQAEEQLAGSEHRFRSLFENAVDGMLLLLRDGTFIDCNTQMEKFFRRTRKVILNRKPWDFSPPKQPDGRNSEEKALELIDAAYRGQPQLFEWVHNRPDDSLIDAEINLSSIELEEETAVLAIVRDITERKNIEKKMQEVREVERTRLARELHDTVSQTLASAGMIAEVLPRIWEKDQKEASGRLQELLGLTRGAQEEMNALLFELYPAALIGREPGELIHQLANNVKRHYQLPINLRITGKFNLTPESKIALYRITQEALNNITKHSKAKSARISLSCHPNQTTLRISDDGTGFNVSKIPEEGMGMRNMRERAEEIGASFDIRSIIGKGTEITIKCKHNSGSNHGGNTH